MVDGPTQVTICKPLQKPEEEFDISCMTMTMPDGTVRAVALISGDQASLNEMMETFGRENILFTKSMEQFSDDYSKISHKSFGAIPVIQDAGPSTINLTDLKPVDLHLSSERPQAESGARERAAKLMAQYNTNLALGAGAGAAVGERIGSSYGNWLRQSALDEAMVPVKNTERALASAEARIAQQKAEVATKRATEERAKELYRTKAVQNFVKKYGDTFFSVPQAETMKREISERALSAAKTVRDNVSLAVEGAKHKLNKVVQREVVNSACARVAGAAAGAYTGVKIVAWQVGKKIVLHPAVSAVDALYEVGKTVQAHNAVEESKKVKDRPVQVIHFPH